MKFSLFKCNFYISFWFVFFVCILLIVDRTGAILFGLISVVIHEFGHLVIMIFCKRYPKSISFQLGGIIINSNNKSKYKYTDLLIAMGGCLLNFVVFLVTYFYLSYIRYNEIILIFCASNMALMLFNLLPVNGLDGMDIIRFSILRKCSVEKEEKIIRLITSFTIVLLVLLCILSIILLDINYSVIICVIYLIILTFINFRS